MQQTLSTTVPPPAPTPSGVKITFNGKPGFAVRLTRDQVIGYWAQSLRDHHMADPAQHPTSFKNMLSNLKVPFINDASETIDLKV